MQICAQNAPKYVWRPDSARTHWGSLSAPHSRNQEGPTSKGREKRKSGREGRVREGEEGEGRGKEGRREEGR